MEEGEKRRVEEGQRVRERKRENMQKTEEGRKERQEKKCFQTEQSLLKWPGRKDRDREGKNNSAVIPQLELF